MNISAKIGDVIKVQATLTNDGDAFDLTGYSTQFSARIDRDSSDNDIEIAGTFPYGGSAGIILFTIPYATSIALSAVGYQYQISIWKADQSDQEVVKEGALTIDKSFKPTIS